MYKLAGGRVQVRVSWFDPAQIVAATVQGCPIGYHQQIDARSSAIMVMILDLDLGTDRREVLSFLHSSREVFFCYCLFW